METERTSISRRGFVALGAVSGIGLAVAPRLVTAQEGQPERPPPLKDDIVREFVGAAHGNLDRVKEMLEETPSLLNATWDWSQGDFEAAIGGAGHMGRRDIALYLIDKGARYDVFVAAMLGELALVKAILEAHPELKSSRGPHGIPLTRHAKAGGAEAEPVMEYLQSIGAT